MHRLLRDRYFLALALLCVVHVAWLAAFLVYPDLNLDYPFLDGDSPEWISNGLRLAGEDVHYTGRSPLLPLAIALLERCGVLSWLPVLLEFLFHATVLAFYGLSVRFAPRWAAFAIALSLLLSHSLQGFAPQIMADLPASCLLFLSARAFVLAGERPRLYVVSGLLAALSYLAQSAALLWAPAAVVTVLWGRPRHLRSPFFYVGLVLFVGLPALVKAALFAFVGTEGNLPARQWELLRLHADSAPFYLWSLAAVLGIPACLLLVPALVAAARRAVARSAPELFNLALLGGLLGFFVFLYDFNARRFLVYIVWPAGLLMAMFLARLPGRIAPWVAALVVIGAALPLPGTGNDPFWVGLWPVPPVYARADFRASREGSPLLVPGSIRIETWPVASLGRFCQPCRVLEARAAWERQPRVARPDPVLYASDRSTLFLYEKDSDGGGRHRTASRLSNALRRRVKFLPADHFEAYWPFLEISAAGVFAPDYAVYRTRLPGLDASWLIVAPFGSRLQSRLDARATLSPSPSPVRGGVPGDARERGPGGEGSARHKAEEILRFLADSDAYLVIVPFRRRADLSQLYLPFLAESTEMILSERGKERELLGLTAGFPVLAERSFGTTQVKKIRLYGRNAGLVSYLPESR